jgi:RNA polymerase sporulation-specific sigma factor
MNETLFIENTPLIKFIIKKMGLKYNLEECYLVGEDALIKAVKTFDESKGYKFSSYATKCIQYELSNYLHYKNTKKRKYDDYLISLDEEIDEERNTLLDLISDETNLENEIIENERINLLKKIIEILEPNDKFMIEHYFELWGNKKMNQKEIAKVLNVKQTYVSYRIKRTMRIIKKIMEEKWN